MQSGAEEEWDDEDWEDDASGSSFIFDMSMASKMKLAGAGAIVFAILIFAMVSQNFGFYYGAGSLTVIIDVNEGKDPGDRTFNANIWATSPAFGMLAKEGSYTITFSGTNQASGNFDLSAKGRASISVDYESFFVTNGAYALNVELGGQTSSNSVTIDRFADSVSGSVSNFNGEYPLDKDSPVIINMQFTAANSESYINPWVSGTVKVYHYENAFNEGQGESYWNDDSERGNTASNWNLVNTIQLDVNSDSGSYSYSSGGTTNFHEVQIPPYNLNLILDVDKFYDEEGSGDYTLVFEFSNDFGGDTSSKDGRSSWQWFHLCDTKDNGDCKSDGS
jgi:hypothetical protein